MSKIMELADAYADTQCDARAALGANAGMDEQDPMWIAMKEARAALVAGAEKLERDAARWKMLAEMESCRTGTETIQYCIAHPDKLDYVISLIPAAMEATNGQGN